jgi:Fur family transcriptional regulator, stress-responsive regulator
VIQPGAPAYTRAGRNCHHLVCRQCGRTEDVDCLAGKRSCLEPGGEHGFAIDEAEVVFRGLCPACAAVSSPNEVDGAHYGKAESTSVMDELLNPQQ